MTNKQIRFFSLMVILLAYSSVHPNEEQDAASQSVTPTFQTKVLRTESIQSELPKSIFEKENLEQLQVNAKEYVANVASTYIPFVHDFGAQSMTQVAKHGKEGLKSFLTISPKDKLECDKVGGVCGAITAFGIASLKRYSSVPKRVFYPLALGWVTYKLVATNQEVKQSLCNSVTFVKDVIK